MSSGEVTFCRINKTKEHITEEGLNNTSTLIHPIGTVILAMIGEGKTRGQAAILNIEACHNQNTAAIRVSEVSYSPEFLYNFLLYHYAETRKAGSGNNQKALNKQRVADLPAPICSLPEQQEIVRLLDEQFTVIEQNEKEITRSLKLSEITRQSILKRAFSGQLVNQNPKDEPASILLKRIQEQQASEALKKPKKKVARKTRHKTEKMKTLLEVLEDQSDWIDSQKLFGLAGIADGSSTREIENLYNELRLNLNKLEIERRGALDWIKLKSKKGGANAS